MILLLTLPVWRYTQRHPFSVTWNKSPQLLSDSDGGGLEGPRTLNSYRWSTIKKCEFHWSWKYVRPIKSRVMPSWICSSWFYFEGSSNLEVVGFAASEKTRKTGWFQGQHTKTWPSSLRSSVDHGTCFLRDAEQGYMLESCWISGFFPRDTPWSADAEACSAGLLAVASDGTGSIVAEWGKVRCESLHLDWTWTGCHWLRWLFVWKKKHPNSCRSEWPMFGRK